ncbi:uncharacterized protein EI90DRAFT_3018050 [Cantharellus anzutake]|uniref:uncharacterized protein n=1 Tax=Cantharellus anzutake TaxID=1750568 RepID=UPI001904892D|nr:uncharacterized protein EI90DRAFT_3018050 [Cantharellus anzutake]KAF8327537.1 hypothetical protein EI90DRAFT_3018050 [Cantharellus anzutake]
MWCWLVSHGSLLLQQAEEAKPWVESAKKLDNALQKIKSKIEQRLKKIEKRPTFVNALSYLKDPGRISGLKKDFDKTLVSFQVRTNLITGAKLAAIERRLHDDRILDSLRDPSIVRENPTQACLEGTRVDLIEHIMTWCRNTGDSENQLMLLTAVAGAGKTSIVLTIAERCASEGDVTLLLRFFFKAGERSWPDFLFSSIARALADHDPVYRTFITSALRNDPTASFAMQFEKLVAPPLLHKPPPSDRPVIIIIDALDECDKEVFESLAEILGDEVPRLPSSIKYFITSRQFDLDCAKFICFQLQKLKKLHRDLRRHLQDEDKMVQKISERANGLFIWISTIFRYMKTANKDPVRALESLLDAGAKRPAVPAEKMMDDLYTSILNQCAWEDEDFAHDYPVVMGAIFVAQEPLSITAWDTILSPFLKSSVRYVLAELAPLLSGVEDNCTPVRILHQSFRDFIVDRINSSISPHCSPVGVETENARVALRCIEILNQDLCSARGLGLIENLSETDEMPRIPPKELSEQFHYACRHVVYHLSGVQEPSEGFARSVDFYLAESLNSLYIALSNLGRHSEALPFIEESVELCHQLVAIHPGSYTPDLAMSLNNLYNSLSDLGRHSEALPFIEECVKIRCQLVGVNPGAYTPKLVNSVENLFRI